MNYKKPLLTILFTFVFIGTSYLMAQPYQTAAGLRFPWGIGINGKHFLKENTAIEANFQMRFLGEAGFDFNQFKLTGLYEIEKPLPEVTEGLYWFFGGGATLGFWTGDFDFPGSDFDSFIFGINGIIGLEYVFADFPVNVQLDWIPGIYFIGESGFDAEYGLFVVRYIIHE